MVLLGGWLVYLLAFLTVAKCEIENDDGVLILTDNNIDEAIKENKFLMVKFYVPCTQGECFKYKEYWTRYNMAASMLAEAGNPSKLGKVNILENPKLAAEHSPVVDHEGYERPTILLFKDGVKRVYTDKVKSRNIVPYMEKRTRPLAVTLDTAEKIKDIKDKNEVVIIGFFSDPESPAAKELVTVANGELDEQEFAIVTDKELMAKFEEADNTIVLYKKFDEGRNVMEGDISVDSISKFVLDNYVPLVFKFDRKESRRIFGQPSEGFLAILDSIHADGHFDRMDLAKKLAKEYKGRITFVLTNIDENRELVEYLHEPEFPTFLMLKNPTDEIENYKPESREYSEENLKHFIDSYLEGKVPVWIPPPKSEKLPEDWDKAPVKVLVGSNFEEVAMDKGKDVLVEFYAPWCGHCQKLAPIYEKLAENFKDVPDLTIAKMDATANEIHGQEVSGYPTIILYKKGDNAVVEYSGGRQLKDLTDFLLENDVQEPKKKEKEEL